MNADEYTIDDTAGYLCQSNVINYQIVKLTGRDKPLRLANIEKIIFSNIDELVKSPKIFTWNELT